MTSPPTTKSTPIPATNDSTSRIPVDLSPDREDADFPEPSVPLQHTSSLRTRTFRAGGWILFAHALSQIIRLANSLILTRLLAPELFGIVAIASAIQIMISLLSDVGLHQAVVQSPRGSAKSFLDTAWTVQIVRGILIWLVCALLAGSLQLASAWHWIETSSVYGDPRLPPVFAALATTAIILGFQSMRAVVQNRALEMKRLTMIEVGSAAANVISSAVTAYFTHSVWSFVVGAIMSASIITALSHTWLPGSADRLAWERPAVEELRRFGKWVFLSSAATAFLMNGDRFLLGLWLSPFTLGVYSIAANLATLIEGLGNRVFTSISFPALSEMARNNPSRFKSVYIRMRWITDAVFVWTAGFLFCTAHLVVSILYDARYAQVGQMLQWLSFGLLFNRFNLAGNVYMALGKPDYAAALNYARLVPLLLFVPILYHFFGIPGAVIGIALHKAPVQLLILRLNRNYDLNDFLLEFAALAFWGVGYLSGLAGVHIAALIGM